MTIRYITGAMRSGKSSLLIDQILASRQEGIPTVCIKPNLDKRDGAKIISRERDMSFNSFSISNENYKNEIYDLQQFIKETYEYQKINIFVDEVHFFKQDILEDIIAVGELANANITFCGLKWSFKFEKFESYLFLKKNADRLIEAKGICEFCYDRNSSEFNLLYNDNKLVTDGNTLQPGDVEYRAVCPTCASKLK